MELILIEKRRPDDDRYTWTPFEHDDRFNPDWWDRLDLYGDSDSYVQVLLDDREVARVELDDHVATCHYTGAPILGAEAQTSGNG